MVTVELTAATDAAGTLQKFYFSDGGFVSEPSDTPPNTVFFDKLREQGRIGINVYSDGRTGGGTRLETGEIVIDNTDGELDGLLNYSFDGRPVVIRTGDGAFPAGFPVVVSGTAEAPQADFDKVVIKIRDKQFMFQTPLITATYTGGNLLPNGAEGSADLKGRVKPLVLGKVFNISPPIVNTSKLTYQVSTNAVVVDAVYDRGVSLTKGADYATLALLEAAAPAASSFVTCNALGLYRLGTNPAGQITADVTQGANAAARTVAQLMKQVALLAGLTAGEVDAASVTALDALSSAEAGIYIADASSTLTVLDTIAESIGAWYGFDGAGVLRMGQLTAPTGVPVAVIEEHDVFKQGMQRRAPKDNGLPVWQVKVKHAKNYTVQPSDLAGAVTTVRRAFLSEENRVAIASDASIKTQWMLAESLEADSLLVNEADANSEALRRLALYKVRREVFDLPIDLNTYIGYNIKLMDLVQVYNKRFGMSAGRLFRLIGYRIELGKNRVILVIWG